MVAFGMRTIWCCTIGKQLPGNHTFADVYATVVYNGTFNNLVTVSF